MQKLKLVILYAVIPVIIIPVQNVYSQQPQFDSCNQYLPPTRKIDDTLVGPESCQMQQAEFSLNGRPFIRVDLGLTGKAEGYVTKQGPYREYLTNSPDLTFQQTGNSYKRYHAIADYERGKGSGILLAFPRNKTDWNGKLWVTAHGRGQSLKSGTLRPWHRYLNPDNPGAIFDKINRLMLSKGYALAVTLRTSEEGIGEISAKLEDGSVVNWVAFNDNSSIIKDFTTVAENVLENYHGATPSRTYLYGHSAGARIGRSINYTNGLNSDSNGNYLFDGFLLDDSATGLWLPVMMKDGIDTLFSNPDETLSFRPQIELVHLLYNRTWDRTSDMPDWISTDYLENKRNNASMLMRKGLADKFRMYEIRQISHNGGERLANGRYGQIRILDLSLIIDGVIDMLDALVEGTDIPPPSRSDWGAIGDADNDGIIEHAAIAFPETTCPLGTYYPWPANGSGYTAFAGFTGEGSEPLDQNGIFIDMNDNGIRDSRENPTQAWQRAGLLQPGEELTREKYLTCITKAVTRLQRSGFFSNQTSVRYIEQAKKQNLNPALLDE